MSDSESQEEPTQVHHESHELQEPATVATWRPDLESEEEPDPPDSSSGYLSNQENGHSSTPASNKSPKSGRSKRILWSGKERLHLAPLQKLMNSPRTNHKDVRWIMAALMKGKVVGDFLEINVTYTYSKKVDFGRWYASWPSLQNCPGFIRRVLSVGIYADVDIKNCFPTLLLQIAERHEIPVPSLHAYVTDRQEWANKICADLSISFNQVKTAVLIAMHGGNYMRATEKKPHTMLHEFTKEVTMIAHTLRELDEYNQLWNDAQRAQKEKASEFDNALGTFISYICQAQEASIIFHVRAYFDQEGRETGSIVFDGCMFYINRPEDVSEDLLERAADYAAEQTGFRIELVVKSLQPTPEDLVKYEACAAPKQTTLLAFSEQQMHLDPRQKLILFDYNGTLGGKKGAILRPGIESLKKLQTAGYAIGIWSNASRENIPLEKMAEVHGLHFSVVLTGEDCEEPTAEYRQRHQLARYDKLKPVSKLFPGWRVIVVDDTPNKIPLVDRHLLRPIKVWKSGDTDDKELPKMVDKLLREDKDVPLASVDQEEKEKPTTFFENAEDIPYEDMPLRKRGEGRALHPIKFQNGVKVCAINAAMGLGKSHVNIEFIERELRKDSGVKMLVVTNRRQQSRTHMAALRGLGFQHYTKIEGRIFDVPRLVIQFESLHKLLQESQDTVFAPSYHYVIIDEVRAVTGQMMSPTNGKKSSANASIYCRLLKEASKGTVLLDADLEADGMVPDLMNELWPVNQQLVRRYTHVALERTIALVDANSWYNCVNRDIKAGRKLFLVFRGQKEMRSWIAAQLARGHFTHQAVDSETSEEEVQKIFEDVNASVRAVQVFCITSKVTTGADIQVEFHRIYANCAVWKGPVARDVYQMIGRARKVENSEVVVTLPVKTGAEEPCVNRELKRLKTQQTDRKNYAALDSCRETMGDGTIVWSKGWRLKAESHYAAEEYEDFCAAFRRHTLRKGYTFVDPAPFLCEDKTFIDEVQQSRLLQDADRKTTDATLLIELQALPMPELCDALNQISSKARDDWTNEEKSKNDLIRVLKRFPLRYSLLTLDEVQWAGKHRRELEMAAWIEKFKEENVNDTSKACKSQDMRTLMDAGFVEQARVKYPVLVLIQELLKVVGFLGLDDSTTQIEASQIEAKSKRVRTKCEEIARFVNARPPRADKAVGLLGFALKLIGYQLKPRRQGKKKKRVSLYSIKPSEMTVSLLPWVEYNLADVSIPEYTCPFIGLEHVTVNKPQLHLSSALAPEEKVNHHAPNAQLLEWWNLILPETRSAIQSFIAEAYRAYSNEPANVSSEKVKRDCTQMFQLSNDEYDWILQQQSQRKRKRGDT